MTMHPLAPLQGGYSSWSEALPEARLEARLDTRPGSTPGPAAFPHKAVAR
ncbi:hypothetical protein ACM1PE_11765 [Achromobacter sp. PD1]|nr:hypothetical protein [Achromobacter aegrifaciens]WLW58977.1 hypothetical protein RA224_17160 [Achromobacter aegrifaciens]